MPKILLIVAIVLMGASAFLGFKTKSKVQELDEQRKQASEAQAQAVKQLTDSQQSEKAAKEAEAQAKAEADQAKSELASAKAASTSAEAKVSSLQSEVADLQKKLAEAPAAGTTPEANDTTLQTLAETQTKLAEAEAKRAEAETVVQGLTAKVKEAEDKNKDLVEYKERHEGQARARGLEAQVVAVNQAWNFVVLSIGERQGVVANSELILKRGSEAIGKVRVTSVEPSTSVADIIPGSLAKGVKVMPGDAVIY